MRFKIANLNCSRAVTRVAQCARPVRVSLLVAFAIFCVGCHGPRVEKPLTASLPSDPLEAQMEFWHGLEDRPITCNDEAFHGLLMFKDGDDDSPDYSARVTKLKSQKLLAANFDRPADEAVQRGVVAVAITRLLKIQGGWALSVLGPTPRYATRELVYRNLFPPSSPEQTFSGAEFVGIIGKAEDFQRGQAAAR